MAATIAPISPAVSTAPVTPVAPDLALQPGTVISAQVMQLLENGLAQIAIDGMAIAAFSEVPLQVGESLKLAVSQTADGVIKLQVVPQGADAPALAIAGAVTGPASVGTTAASSSVSAVSTSTPSTSVSTETVAIAVATQAAASRQQSLSPLFANLPVIVISDAAPPAVQAGAAQLLALRPELTEQLNASDLRAAFDQSGLFLEASLASGTAPAPTTDLKAALVTFREVVSNWLAASGEGVAAGATPQVVPQQVAPPLVPAQTIATDLPATPAAPSAPIAMADAAIVAANSSRAIASETLVQTGLPQPSPQIAGDPAATITSAVQKLPAATNLIIAALEAAQQPLEGEAVRGAPQAVSASIKALQAVLNVAAITRSPADSAPQSAPQAARVVATAPPHADSPASAPPPFRGAAPAAQAIAQPSLAPETAPKDIQHLLAQTDGAIARQTLLQVASLPDRVDGAGAQFNAQVSDTSQQRWHFEIPFALPQGTALAQFEIERDGSGNQVEATPQKVWRARFTLNIEPTGPVHALVSLNGDKTAVRMWAERPETAAKIRAQSSDLVQALRAAALEPGDIVVSGGAPPQGPAKAGHFLDRAS
jgi:hypothetical protein